MKHLDQLSRQWATACFATLDLFGRLTDEMHPVLAIVLGLAPFFVLKLLTPFWVFAVATGLLAAIVLTVCVHLFWAYQLTRSQQ